MFIWYNPAPCYQTPRAFFGSEPCRGAPLWGEYIALCFVVLIIKRTVHDALRCSRSMKIPQPCVAAVVCSIGVLPMELKTSGLSTGLPYPQENSLRERTGMFSQKFEPGNLQVSLIKCGHSAFDFHHNCSQRVREVFGQVVRTHKTPIHVLQFLFKQWKLLCHSGLDEGGPYLPGIGTVCSKTAQREMSSHTPSLFLLRQEFTMWS